MPIAEGASIPSDLQGTVMGDDGPAPVNLAELVAGKKSVIFGIPGAFTPTCSKQHLPGYVDDAAALEAKGIEQVICMSTNDIFVLSAWNAANGGANVTMLADGSGDITRALDLGLDLSARGMGYRTTRFAMIVDDGTVHALNVEESPGTCTVSSAQGILERV